MAHVRQRIMAVLRSKFGWLGRLDNLHTGKGVQVRAFEGQGPTPYQEGTAVDVWHSRSALGHMIPNECHECWALQFDSPSSPLGWLESGEECLKR